MRKPPRWHTRPPQLGLPAWQQGLPARAMLAGSALAQAALPRRRRPADGPFLTSKASSDAAMEGPPKDATDAIIQNALKEEERERMAKKKAKEQDGGSGWLCSIKEAIWVSCYCVGAAKQP